MMVDKKWVGKPAAAVGNYVRDIQGKETGSGTKHKAEISDLRRNVHKSLDEDMKAFSRVSQLLARNGWSVPRGSMITPEEEAVGAALSLFAVHYGTKVRFPHKEGVGFGTAAANIQFSSQNDLIIKRMESIFRSNSLGEYRRHIKSILDFASNERSSFDYELFTQDLLNLTRPEKKNAVLTKWVRQFHTETYNLTNKKDK